MRRSVYRAVACLCSLVVLGGCVPPETGGWAALRLSDNGDLRIVMSLCSGENADSLSVFTQGEANSAAWDALAPIESRDDGPTEFTLFEAPPAWDVDEEGDLEPLVDGVLYGLSATTTGYDAAGGMTRPRRSGVDFSLDQLRQLGDGEVLVTTESFEGAVKSLEEFESDAEATC